MVARWPVAPHGVHQGNDQQSHGYVVFDEEAVSEKIGIEGIDGGGGNGGDRAAQSPGPPSDQSAQKHGKGEHAGTTRVNQRPAAFPGVR